MSGSVAVVGGGPAGLMAARAAVLHGAAVTLIDEAHQPGGQIYRQPSAPMRRIAIGLEGELARKRRVLAAFAEVADRVEYLAGGVAYSLFEGPELHVAHGGATSILRPDVIVLATGVCERAYPFPGWTLPGVCFAGGVQATLKANGVRAGDRVVVTGVGPLPIAVAAQLVAASAEVEVVALANGLSSMLRRPWGLWAGRSIVSEGFSYLRTLRQAGVEQLSGWIPVRAEGARQLERVTLAKHAAGVPIAGSERTLECDLLALNYGFIANSELVRMAGAEMDFAPDRGGWIPPTDAFGRTSVDRVMVAGDGAGLRGALVDEIEGEIVGAIAAARTCGRLEDGFEHKFSAAIRARRRHEQFQKAVQESLRLPDGVWSIAADDTTCCRCECVSRARIQRAIADGHTSVNAIKRTTRAAMGWCGGRMCTHTIAALAGGGRLKGEVEQMTPRPVARLVSLGENANRTLEQ